MTDKQPRVERKCMPNGKDVEKINNETWDKNVNSQTGTQVEQVSQKLAKQ